MWDILRGVGDLLKDPEVHSPGMVCAHCGLDNSDASNFCTGCGRALKAAAPSSYTVLVSDLPDSCRVRLLAAIKSPPPETFVINESKRGWAIVVLVGSILGVLLVLSDANGYKWQQEDALTYLALTVTCFVVGLLSLRYLSKCVRAEFKAHSLINPLYFLRIRFDRIDVVSLLAPDAWQVTHRKDSRGNYAGSVFSFRGAGGALKLKVNFVSAANELISALNRFPSLIAGLFEGEDFDRLRAFDLLFEWRQREKSFPRGSPESTSRRKLFKGCLGAAAVAAVVAVAVFYLAISPFNDHRDDELRWGTAKTTSTATAYRLYVASRPNGTHVSDAMEAISGLYDRAAESYREAGGQTTSPGIEAVISILEYAKHTGRYKVIVRFKGDNEIPDDIDRRIESHYGLSKIVPVLPSFSSSMNEARQERILERISSSFGKVIPGDILQFTSGEANPKDPLFNITYVITASGTVYYPEKQERLPEASRDWYTGISFLWNFDISVPDANASKFQFSLASHPAEEFNVSYEEAVGSDTGFSPIQAYGAMADSAFDDFSSKLLAELSVR